MLSEVKGKVLIAIDTSLKEPYITLTRDGPLQTWVPVEVTDVETVIYYSKEPGHFLIWLNALIENWRWRGGSPKAYLVSACLYFFLLPFRVFVPSYSVGHFFEGSVKQLQINLPETLFAQRWKKLAIMDYFIKHSSCDYLLLVTPSCYIRKSLLINILSALPKNEDIYSGSLQRNHDGPFIAGGALLINKEVAHKFLANKFRIPTHTMDDVGFGILASKLGVTLSELQAMSIDLLAAEDVLRAKQSFYVRLKSSYEGKRMDAILMQQFHKEVHQSD